jgi:peptidoglycan/xylan/chitin deacetylase (PgdA/CDA1 family)
MLFLAVSLLLLALVWRLSSAPDVQLFGELHDRVEVTEPLVALTFDDGPNPLFTEQILQHLKDADVRATFFLIGQEAQANTSLVQQIVAAGHQVGNHSFSHRRLLFKSPATIAREVSHTDEILRANGVDGVIYFRPPYGKKLVLLPWHLMRHHRVSVTWDVAPENFHDIAADKDKLVQYTLDNVKPGSIILLHVMYSSRQVTMQAVPEIIAGLKAKGYRLVTVHELLRAGGKA